MTDGGPAFPRAAFAPHDVGQEDVGVHDSQEGMSLRDYFAGQILVGFLAGRKEPVGGEYKDTVAATCYKWADAMLKARTPNKGARNE